MHPSEGMEEDGGQRVVTLLVYLTDLEEEDGGATIFRDLRYPEGGPKGAIRVRPKKGSALIFFPAAGGIPETPLDVRTLHCGEMVSETAKNDKWIAQMWLRQDMYTPTAPPGNVHAKAHDAIVAWIDEQEPAKPPAELQNVAMTALEEPSTSGE